MVDKFVGDLLPRYREELSRPPEFHILPDDHRINPNTDAVVIHGNDNVDENRARIEGAWKVYQAVLARGSERINTQTPFFIMDGSKQEIDWFHTWLGEKRETDPTFPFDVVETLENQPNPNSNKADTKTNMEVLRANHPNFHHVTLITSSYHVVRVEETAKQHLLQPAKTPGEADIFTSTVIGVPFSRHNVFHDVYHEAHILQAYHNQHASEKTLETAPTGEAQSTEEAA